MWFVYLAILVVLTLAIVGLALVLSAEQQAKRNALHDPDHLGDRHRA
ncbi:hypothetical protein [Orlajensenia leifsoniae]|nr:hypothetical protein [Leifsonia flava]